MSAISITAANVAAGAGAVTEDVIFGEALTAGVPVYKDTTGKVLKADANLSAASAEVYGITLNGGANGQPGKIIRSGRLTTGATMDVGAVYRLGATAGEIVPNGDFATAEYVSLIFVAVTATVAVLCVLNSGVTRTDEA